MRRTDTKIRNTRSPEARYVLPGIVLVLLAVWKAWQGEWLDTAFCLAGLLGGGYFVRHEIRKVTSGVSEFLVGDGVVRVGLTYDSVPPPFIGKKLVPLAVRDALALPMAMLLQGENLVLEKDTGRTAGRNAFRMTVPLSAIQSVTEGKATLPKGGPSVAINLFNKRTLLLGMHFGSHEQATQVVDYLNEVRSAVTPNPTGRITVSADELHRRTQRAKR